MLSWPCFLLKLTTKCEEYMLGIRLTRFRTQLPHHFQIPNHPHQPGSQRDLRNILGKSPVECHALFKVPLQHTFGVFRDRMEKKKGRQVRQGHCPS
ncbi:hypothetical protein TNCT_299411 [Trichonephila clavata]|uniref:Uncharacterized protein n=1 Tax=Trichonephila clavata TaxID=2740835 RepID=A0A8X6JD22_TRICU|nr:hypothetical protein TNCT_299411 [Trichonephila clavata]